MRGISRAVLMLGVLPAVACAPKVSAGAWQCSTDAGAADAAPDHVAVLTDPVVVPWASGFEDGFCDYTQLAGSCYGDAPWVTVSNPVHSGYSAAAFKVVGASPGVNTYHQTRCSRRGGLPEKAYYGAWYYIPEALRSASDWTLYHLQGGTDPDHQHYLWTVTLVKGAQAGTWELAVNDFVAGSFYNNTDHTVIPTGKDALGREQWFHIELFLKRAADSTGEIALYQDGKQLLRQTNLKSELNPYAEWYVGDLADNGDPKDSVLYVDDVSISTALSATQ